MPATEIGVKIAAQMSPEPSEEELRFVRQMGIEYVTLWTDSTKAGYDYYASRRQLFENADLKIYGFGNWDVHNQDAIVLNLPGRAAKVAQYKQHLRDLGRLGIPYTTTPIWRTASGAPSASRHGAAQRPCLRTLKGRQRSLAWSGLLRPTFSRAHLYR